MSNRRKMFKSRKRKNGNEHTPNLISEGALDKIEVPKSEKVVHKTVPAKAGDEIIGEAIIYEDGTIDVVVHGDISDEAKEALYSFKQTMLGTDGDIEDGSPQ